MIEHLDGIKETVRYLGETRIRYYYNVENEAYPDHWHTAAEIIMPIREDYYLTIQGQDVVLTPGDVLWIGPGVLHSMRNPNNNGERLIVLFDLSVLNQFPEISSILPMMSPFFLVQEDSNPILQAKIKALLDNVIKINSEGHSFSEVLTYAHLIALSVELGESLLESMNHSGSLKSPESDEPTIQAQVSSIYKACYYIRTHSREDITLESTAQEVGLSKYYFSRMFKDIVGASFSDYLNQCRIDDVQLIITNPDISITEAATLAGFNSISTFNRAFKKCKNMTPSKFRSLVRNQYETCEDEDSNRA